MIQFEFEGVHYQVSSNARRPTTTQDYIQIPDGRILAITKWSETIPPSPLEIRLSQVDTLLLPPHIPMAEIVQ